MNAISIVAGEMPKLSAVRAAENLCVEVVWAKGPRGTRTETVDLAPIINSLKAYKRLCTDRTLFESVRHAEEGEVIAWGEDDAIEMAVTTVERLAEEMLTALGFQIFIASLD